MLSAPLRILAPLVLVAACGDTPQQGPAGADGATTLVSTSTEPAGANCAAGGVRIDVGVDDNGDGVLDASEIDHTTYVCSGEAIAHDSLVSVTEEPAGANCADGGQRIDTGVDDNDNGVLDADEIDRTTYVCNGSAGQHGLQSLLVVTPEPAGTNCADGGQRIDYGIDDNGNGTLEAAEIDGTSYACDGATGGTGLQSLVKITPEPADFTCPAAGQRIDYGIDDDSNGTLDAAEIDGTSYVCNGGSVSLLTNGDFATDLSGWTLANNAVGGFDTVDTFMRLGTGRLMNQHATSPVAAVIYQDFTVPAGIMFAGFRTGYASTGSEDPLDPQDVTTIEKDPNNSGGNGLQNAFRIDIVDPTGAQFYEPILYTLAAPTSPMGVIDGPLATLTDQTAALTAFFQAHEGETLRLRIGQVESTFEFNVQLDNVTLVVGTH